MKHQPKQDDFLCASVQLYDLCLAHVKGSLSSGEIDQNNVRLVRRLVCLKKCWWCIMSCKRGDISKFNTCHLDIAVCVAKTKHQCCHFFKGSKITNINKNKIWCNDKFGQTDKSLFEVWHSKKYIPFHQNQNPPQKNVNITGHLSHTMKSNV